MDIFMDSIIVIFIRYPNFTLINLQKHLFTITIRLPGTYDLHHDTTGYDTEKYIEIETN